MYSHAPRVLAFLFCRGELIYLGDILTRPEHSLLTQARRAYTYTPGADASVNYCPEKHVKRNHAINADGFGVGYFNTEIRPEGALFKSTTPAWSNNNLIELSEVTLCNVCFAHIRAASAGMPLSEFNCHPFRHGKFMWMHNGGIAHYSSIKRLLLAALPRNVYKNIQGTTDSEVSFGIFMSQFPDQGIHGPGAQYTKNKKYYTPKQIEVAMRNTVVTIMEAHKRHGYTKQEAASSLNFACTDGETIVALRCRTHDSQDPPTLYYACSDEEFTLQGSSSKNAAITPPKRRQRAGRRPITPRTSNLRKQITLSSGSDDCCSTFIIASEPLDYVDTKWHLVPKDTMVVVANNTLQLIPLRLPNYDDIGEIVLTPAFTAFDESSAPNFEKNDKPFSLSGCNTGYNCKNNQAGTVPSKRNQSLRRKASFRPVSSNKCDLQLGCKNNLQNVNDHKNIFRTLARTPRQTLSRGNYINKNCNARNNEILEIKEHKNEIIQQSSPSSKIGKKLTATKESGHEEVAASSSATLHDYSSLFSNQYIHTFIMCAISFSIGMMIHQRKA